jgi:outer membrane protein
MNVKRIILSAFAIGLCAFSFAQKIAHLEVDSLIAMMPETKTAKEIAQKYYQDLEKTAGSMDNEFQTKYNEYLSSDPNNMSQLVRKTKEEELQSLQRRIEEFRMQAQQDYQTKTAQLTSPIMEKAKKGIEAVAKEGGYKYVLDTSTGNVLYADPAEDILMTVKKKLDSMPAAVIPGANQGVDKPKSAPEKPKTSPKSGGK